MKRTALALTFILALLVSTMVGVTTVNFGTAQSGSNVNGIITSNTTWTQANSPYTLTGSVAVNAGVTLTIQAGVTVNLNGNYLQVNGTLFAIGTSTNKIQFNGGSITFTTVGNGWNDQTGSGSIIQYANVTSTIVSVQSPAKIDHNTLNGNIMMNNVISANCGVISNNTVTASYGDGIACSGNASISGNTIVGALWGGIDAFSGSPTIQGNLVTNNMGWNGVMSQGGIVVRNGGSESVPTTPFIEDNTITNNNLGITIGSQGSQAISPIILNNNIYGNQKYNFYLNQITYNVTVSNNWWGTTDTQAIGQTIYDYKNNFNLGNVSFIPFLSASDPLAPAQTYNPNPTPTPSPSPTPTPTTTPTSTPAPTTATSPTPTSTPINLSVSPSPSPTPTISEFSIWIILPLFAVIILLSIVFIRKRIPKKSSLFLF